MATYQYNFDHWDIPAAMIGNPKTQLYSMADSPKLCLITGGNAGLGFETAKNLLLPSPTYHILLGSRDINKGNAAASLLESLGIKGHVTPIQIDVENDASVEAAAAWVEKTYGRLDILVNNAGMSIPDPSVPLRDAVRKVLSVNTVGVVSVTEAFLPLLRKGNEPRVVFVSSSIGSITHASDPTSRYYSPKGTSYRASKAALNMIMVQYHALLKDEGFKIHGADPGLNATNLTGDVNSLRARGALEPSVGGERIATVIRGERDEDVGKVCGEYGISPW